MNKSYTNQNQQVTVVFTRCMLYRAVQLTNQTDESLKQYINTTQYVYII